MDKQEKIERKYLAHFIDSNFGKGTANYIRLGKDLEEYNIEMNPETENKRNIIGENSVSVKGYEPSSSVDTYYAYKGDALFEQLSKIVNERLTGSDLETTVVDLLLDGATGAVEWAYRENVVVVPQSMGGGADGVQIPFSINYNGSREKGTFALEEKTWSKE